MTAHRARLAGLLATLSLAAALGGCGDGGSDDSGGSGTPTNPPPDAPAFEPPPEFLDCMANEGIEIPASGDLHDLDPRQVQEAIQLCGEFLHP